MNYTPIGADPKHTPNYINFATWLKAMKLPFYPIPHIRG